MILNCDILFESEINNLKSAESDKRLHRKVLLNKSEPDIQLLFMDSQYGGPCIVFPVQVTAEIYQ